MVDGGAHAVLGEALPVDDAGVVFHLQAHVVVEGDELHGAALLGEVQRGTTPPGGGRCRRRR